MSNEFADIFARACAEVGIDPTAAELVRMSENAIFRLPEVCVGRVGRKGQARSALRETQISRWMATVGMASVKAIQGIQQPVVVDGHPVTFWEELAPHENGSPVQVAKALRSLHSASRPTEFEIPRLDPFVRLRERIDGSRTVLEENDAEWLMERVRSLRTRYAEIPGGLPQCVVHGDAWVGNIVSSINGEVLFLDLERCSIGPPEWDLVSTAIKNTSFGWISNDDYGEFVSAYGFDVTEWEGFEVLRDIRELRMTSMAVQVAATKKDSKEQANWRLECLRGIHGNRPWSGWEALP